MIAPKHPDFEARLKEELEVGRQARIDFLDGVDNSAKYAANSHLFYHYVNRQKHLAARLKRGDNDGFEF